MGCNFGCFKTGIAIREFSKHKLKLLGGMGCNFECCKTEIAIRELLKYKSKTTRRNEL